MNTIKQEAIHNAYKELIKLDLDLLVYFEEVLTEVNLNPVENVRKAMKVIKELNIACKDAENIDCLSCIDIYISLQTAIVYYNCNGAADHAMEHIQELLKCYKIKSRQLKNIKSLSVGNIFKEHVALTIKEEKKQHINNLLNYCKNN